MNDLSDREHPKKRHQLQFLYGQRADGRAARLGQADCNGALRRLRRFPYPFLLRRRGGRGDPAAALLTDPHMLVACGGWLATLLLLLDWRSDAAFAPDGASAIDAGWGD